VTRAADYNAAMATAAMQQSAERDLARRILAACGAEPSAIEPLARFNNPVFRCALPDGSRILKISKSPDGAATRKELLLIEHLARHGVPTPDVERADADGALAGRPFMLMRSSGEQTVADLLGHGDVAHQLLTEMGSTLARIHQAPTDGLPLSATDRVSPQGVANYLETLGATAAALAEQSLLTVEEVARFRALEMPSAVGESLCHSDFHVVQCVVHEGRVAAVVDWESAWIGNPLIDLAISHAYLDYYCPLALTRSFLSGYLSLREIPSEYGLGYLPVRMAQVLGMLRAWYTRGPEIWHAAIVQQKVARAVRLFRLYAQRLAS